MHQTTSAERTSSRADSDAEVATESLLAAHPASDPKRARTTFVRGSVSLVADVIGELNGQALLILDGIGCSGWAFRRVIPPLARAVPIILPHYRGHGATPSPPQPWVLGMDELADDAAHILRSLHVDQVVAVGFSMGFQVAVELYKRHRDLVAGLVSIAGPSGRALSGFQNTDAFERILPAVVAAARHTHGFTHTLWRRFLPSKWAQILGLHTQVNAVRIELSDFEFYLRQMASMDPMLFLEMLREASRHCTDDVLSRIRVPSVVIAGGRDHFVPLDVMRRVAFSVPNSTWVVLPEASHALPAEYPEQIVQHLRTVLADCLAVSFDESS